MSDSPLLQELHDHMAAHPDTRFMDVFAPDLNGILRGKRIQVDDFSKLFSTVQPAIGSSM